MKHNKKLLSRIIGITLLSCSSISYGANWLMLQGTEPNGVAARARLWGFIQAQYQKDTSNPNAKNQYIPPKLIGPDLNSQDMFNVNRARIGVRGTGFPLDNKVNYFFLAEFGNNAITALGDRNVRVTDASITLSYIPGARIRMGLFKYPGAEEGLQAIHVFNYINFTSVSNQLLLERFPNNNGANDSTNNIKPITLPSQTGMNAFNSSVSAFRDTGVQVFDAFRVNNWEHTYAIMYGNGNGLNFGNADGYYDTYLYWSSEYLFGKGKGVHREGLKMFIWDQSGKRLLDSTNDQKYNPTTHARDRSGLGFMYLKHPFRVTAEYMQGKGMIFVGPDKASFDINGPTKPGGNSADAKASGYYLEGGWYIPNTNWELDARYDAYDRMKGDKFEIKFDTLTLGTQYYFNKKSRLTIDIASQNAKALNFASGKGPNANLEGLGTRYAIQMTHIF